MYCVIIEDNPVIAEDIAATLRKRFPASELRMFVSIDQAREAISPSSALAVVVISMGAAVSGQITEEDLDRLDTSPVLWIDAPPEHLENRQRWAQVNKPFSQGMLHSAIDTLLPEFKKP